MLSVVVLAVALLAATSLLMARMQGQVRIIGAEAAPQASTAADLYFALSDLDAQVARLVLIGRTPALAGSRIDALGTYQQRSRQIDADLQRALTTGTTTADRATVLALMNQLAVYRQWTWQAMAVESQAPPQPPGTLPPAALGYYTQATNVMHLDLLPAAQRLRDSGQDRVDRAYTAERVTETLGIVLAVLLGGALVALLVGLQMWLARRFRRMVNPALVLATLITLGLMVAAGVVFAVDGSRLRAARADSLSPYLALSRSQAIAYDAAADTSRYLISGNLAYYREDFARKSDQVVVDPGMLDRWRAYQRDHERIVALADAGQVAAAVDSLTGIRRGDAAFDFSYFDAAVSTRTAAHRQAFDVSLRDAEGRLTGWTVFPIAAMGLVILLVFVGVRARLREYR
jgi:hypothetical protein